MPDIILEMKNITKEFPGVRALDNISFEVKRGEIHALVGENGAGKSTLMKVLSGVYPCGTYDGEIYINGKLVKFNSTRDSEKAGIAIIYQELELIKELNIAENIFLGKLRNASGIVNWDKTYFEAGELLDRIGIKIDLSTKIKDIGIGQQQLVEIAKALSVNADILILDEPTAALTEAEVDILMRIIRSLKEQGVTSILISHKLNEVMEICDRVTVIRDGTSVGTSDVKDLNEDAIIKMMVGRDIKNRYPEKTCAIGNKVLEIKNFTKYDVDNKEKKTLDDICFHVRSGEILGIAGLMGAGRTELLMSIIGYMAGKQEGKILINGKEISIDSPKQAIESGIGLVTEDRKRLGLVLIQSVVNNATLASLKAVSKIGVLSQNREVFETNKYVDSLGIKTHGVDAIVNTLSGGNQQKVLLARCLMTKPRILFLDEPTRGIDVGAKYEIYCLMNQLASNGTAIVMVSSELPEVLGMSDRIVVMHEGRLTGEFSRVDATQEKIMIKASGGN